MRRFVWAVAALCCLLATGALAENITGVVVEDGLGSLRVKDDAGKEVLLNTGRVTVYVPEEYRPLLGDKVSAAYDVETNRRGTTLSVVKELKRVAADPRNVPPASPVSGTIEEVGRKMVRVHIPSRNGALTFEFTRGMPSVPNALKDPKAGDKVKVFFSCVPSRFGNKYVYQLHGFQKE